MSSRKGVIKIVRGEEDLQLEGGEGEGEEGEGRVNIVQVVETDGGVSTRITESNVQQL